VLKLVVHTSILTTRLERVNATFLIVLANLIFHEKRDDKDSLFGHLNLHYSLSS
jgi:hypothetical protein